jgi:hypothetical protein
MIKLIGSLVRLLLVAGCALPLVASAAPGDADATFGTNGVAGFHIDASVDEAKVVV